MNREKTFTKATSVMLSLLLALNCFGITGLAFADESESKQAASASSSSQAAGPPTQTDQTSGQAGQSTAQSASTNDPASEPEPLSAEEDNATPSGSQENPQNQPSASSGSGTASEDTNKTTAEQNNRPAVALPEPKTSNPDESKGSENAKPQLNTSPIKGTKSSEGVTVKVTAPKGSFPQGTTVAIETIAAESDRIGFDITFRDPSGSEVQPTGSSVSLAFTISESSILLSNGEVAELSVYHKNGDGTVEKLCSTTPGEGNTQINVEATHFSEYGVVSSQADSTENDDAAVSETRKTRSSTSTDLSEFLTAVSIDAPTNESGAYIINPNSSYAITLEFNEKESLQFDNDNPLVYSFPSGIIVADIGQTTFPITVTDANGTVVVNDNTYEVVDGKLRVRFNHGDPNFSRLIAAANASFDIDIVSQFDQSITSILFNTIIVKDFVFEENSNLSITKRVEYDMATDTARYVVQVTSEGENETVRIDDALEGTALIFNQDLQIESSLLGALTVTPDYTSLANGYVVVIPRMAHGEILTLRYSATVDNTKISGQGTVEQTENRARVKSDQVPTYKEARTDFAGKVELHIISKKTEASVVCVTRG